MIVKGVVHVLGASLGVVVAVFVAGCSSGASSVPAGLVAAARSAPPHSTANNDSNHVPTAARPKCTRRRVTTADDGREMVVYTEDYGPCSPDRPAAVTRAATE